MTVMPTPAARRLAADLRAPQDVQIRAEESTADSPLTRLGVDGPAPAPLRCLVVDDESGVRDTLRRGLYKKAGIVVLAAASGEEALEVLARDADINVVLMDLHMPGLDGRVTLTRILARHEDVAVIMLTGANEADVAVGCLRDGAADFVSKPVIIGEIVERIQKAVEKQQLRRERRYYQAHLEHRVQELGERLRQQFLESVEALVHALEAKDPYTAGHSLRVSVYAGWIAARVVPAQHEIIVRAAKLHDVGKIGIREGVLDKRDRLDEREWQAMRAHPVLGERILLPIARGEPIILRIARSHHERMDGQGFPDGLTGEAIPLAARIVAVADAFDAMTSTRPYREARTPDAAIAELERCRGSQWDAVLVDVFVEEVRRRGVVTTDDEGSLPTRDGAT